MEPVASEIRDQFGVFFTRLARRVIDVRDVEPVTGGSIQPAYAATLASGEKLFVKTGPPEDMARLAAEARGLKALADTGALRVPEVLLVGGEGRHCYLVLEYLDLHPGGPGSFARLGRALAAQHRPAASRFGFDRDNFIGAAVQSNVQSDHWPEFFSRARLLPQLRRAAAGPHAGAWIDAGLRLAEAGAQFFPGYAPAPSLLHGDLWRGNAGFLVDGTPVIYDPAVYHGDRECDLAMTELFGGFAPEFLAAYREAWPLDAGYITRRDLYNLYPVLNHVNRFGAGYLQQAQALIHKLLAQI